MRGSFQSFASFALSCVLAFAFVGDCISAPALANPTSAATRSSTLIATNTAIAPPTSVPTGLLLDGIAAPLGAYSCNDRLATAYTGPLIRVRRSTGGEQDIGADGNNVIDRSAISSFCGANDCFVVTAYDQGGSGRNITQTTAARQPQIVTAGTLSTSGGNVVWDNAGANSADGLARTDALTLSGNHSLSIFVLGRTRNTADQQYWVRLGNTNGYVIGHPGNTNIITTWGTNPGDNTWTSSVGTAYQYLVASYDSSTNNDQVYQNGNTLSHTTYNSVAINMANTQLQVGYSFGAHSISTIVIWGSVLSSGDRSVVNTWAEVRRTN